jgi:AcrR family transcriptional regulator
LLCGQTHTVVTAREVPRRTQAERRRATRQALIDAALVRMEGGESFDNISLRSVAKAAGVVPTAFYRHFATMDELGLALVEESFRTLRAMLRQAREEGLPPHQMIRGSVETLVGFVGNNRPHFMFVARGRASDNTMLRRAIRAEIRVFTNELAMDLGRLPVLADLATDDLQMVAALLVNAMISTVDAILDTPPDDTHAIDEIRQLAEKQLRLVMLGVPRWRPVRPA